MLKPFLHCLEVVFWVDREPNVADVAQDTLGIKLAHIGVFGKEGVPLLECVDVLVAAKEWGGVGWEVWFKGSSETARHIENLHFLGEAALPVCVPRDRTVRRVGAQTDPFVTRGT
jgi:hypothetical protein